MASGTAFTNPRSIQIAKGSENAMCGRISDPRVFSWPKSRMRKNRGIVRASTGTIWATRNMISKVVRKRNRNRVTAVAARNAMSAEAITTVHATTRLLTK